MKAIDYITSGHLMQGVLDALDAHPLIREAGLYTIYVIDTQETLFSNDERKVHTVNMQPEYSASVEYNLDLTLKRENKVRAADFTRPLLKLMKNNILEEKFFKIICPVTYVSHSNENSKYSFMVKIYLKD